MADPRIGTVTAAPVFDANALSQGQSSDPAARALQIQAGRQQMSINNQQIAMQQKAFDLQKQTTEANLAFQRQQAEMAQRVEARSQEVHNQTLKWAERMNPIMEAQQQGALEEQKVVLENKKREQTISDLTLRDMRMKNTLAALQMAYATVSTANKAKKDKARYTALTTEGLKFLDNLRAEGAIRNHEITQIHNILIGPAARELTAALDAVPQIGSVQDGKFVAAADEIKRLQEYNAKVRELESKVGVERITALFKQAPSVATAQEKAILTLQYMFGAKAGDKEPFAAAKAVEAAVTSKREADAWEAVKKVWPSVAATDPAKAKKLVLESSVGVLTPEIQTAVNAWKAAFSAVSVGDNPNATTVPYVSLVNMQNKYAGLLQATKNGDWKTVNEASLAEKAGLFTLIMDGADMLSRSSAPGAADSAKALSNLLLDLKRNMPDWSRAMAFRDPGSDPTIAMSGLTELVTKAENEVVGTAQVLHAGGKLATVYARYLNGNGGVEMSGDDLVNAFISAMNGGD
jgi:hypothetical protein